MEAQELEAFSARDSIAAQPRAPCALPSFLALPEPYLLAQTEKPHPPMVEILPD